MTALDIIVDNKLNVEQIVAFALSFDHHYVLIITALHDRGLRIPWSSKFNPCNLHIEPTHRNEIAVLEKSMSSFLFYVEERCQCQCHCENKYPIVPHRRALKITVHTSVTCCHVTGLTHTTHVI